MHIQAAIVYPPRSMILKRIAEQGRLSLIIAAMAISSTADAASWKGASSSSGKKLASATIKSFTWIEIAIKVGSYFSSRD